MFHEVQIWTHPETGVIPRSRPNAHDRWGSTCRHCITACFFPSLLDSSCLISDFSLVDRLQPTLFPSNFCLTSFWWTFSKNTNCPGHGALPKCWDYSRLLLCSFAIFCFHVMPYLFPSFLAPPFYWYFYFLLFSVAHIPIINIAFLTSLPFHSWSRPQ